MRKESVKPIEGKPFTMTGEVRIDNRNRSEIYEVNCDGVTLEMTANLNEAISAQRATSGSRLWKINMNTGKKTLRVPV